MKKKKVSETPALSAPGTLPSEAKTAPKSSGSEGVKKKKALPELPKKKKIIGLMGMEYDPGPPGSWHG